MISNDIYLKTALRAAKAGEKIFRRNFGCPKGVRTKDGNARNYVTEADLKIEKLIRAQIKKDFPDHKIIGEELGKDKPDKNDLYWVIDPIDGTANFIHGVPFCCISIALWKGQEPLIAVVNSPMTGDIYQAMRDKGAFLNGRRINVSRIKELKQALGTAGWGRDVKIGDKLLPWLMKTASKARAFGSAALELCKVADGSIDVFVHGSINFWDVAAGMLILQEAGGKITDWEGKKLRIELDRFAASNGQFHKELLAQIKKADFYNR